MFFMYKTQSGPTILIRNKLNKSVYEQIKESAIVYTKSRKCSIGSKL